MRRSCVVCGRPTGLLNPICDECFNELVKVEKPFNAKTSRPLKNEYDDDEILDFKYLVSNRAYCVYDELAASILKEFKYNGHFRIYKSIALKVASLIKIHLDLVVPVPAPASTLISRGYNQSALIAREVCKILNIEYLSPLKSVKSKRQVGSSTVQRIKNIKGTVLPKKRYEELVKGKVVAIIDDVFTTGSTINEVSKVLAFMGAKKVFSFTFSITPKV